MSGRDQAASFRGDRTPRSQAALSHRTVTAIITADAGIVTPRAHILAADSAVWSRPASRRRVRKVLILTRCNSAAEGRRWRALDDVAPGLLALGLETLGTMTSDRSGHLADDETAAERVGKVPVPCCSDWTALDGGVDYDELIWPTDQSGPCFDEIQGRPLRRCRAGSAGRASVTGSRHCVLQCSLCRHQSATANRPRKKRPTRRRQTRQRRDGNRAEETEHG